ncbi:Salivary glue protein Sgs-4 [Folsomia candida]|uniref:Salivary glue protein Sgs-4 n=1 Tax=Folsomia candida TaxID=158441 RepID=A0A226D7F1_FOLCA|nr:Salivary glue protein Sgs-4 [Folsomia candida]
MAIPLLNGQPLTLFTFAAAVHDEERALQFALALNMIPHELQCPNCLQNMGMQPKPSYKLGFRFRCKGCKIYRSPLENTFFENVKLPLLTVMQLLVMWFFRIPVTQAKIHAQIHRQTATDFYSFCREVCAVAHGHDEQQIGGPGDVVECDETHLFTPKYHRGRPLERSLWVFGGISRTTRKRFVVQIRAKDRDTLFGLMQKHIAQKSWVFTDEWRAYLTCESLGFAGHANVNHSRRFVNRRRVLIRGAKPRLGRPIVGRRTNTLRSIPTQEECFLQYIHDCVRVYPGSFSHSPRVSHNPPVVSHLPPVFLTFSQSYLTFPQCFSHSPSRISHSPRVSHIPPEFLTIPQSYLTFPQCFSHSPEFLTIPQSYLTFPQCFSHSPEFLTIPQSYRTFPQCFSHSPRVSHNPPVVSHLPPEFLTFPQSYLTFPQSFSHSPSRISHSPRVSHIPPVVSHIPPVFLTFPQSYLTFPQSFSHSPSRISHSPSVSHIPPVVSHIPLEFLTIPQSYLTFPSVSHIPPVVSLIPPEFLTIPQSYLTFPQSFSQSPSRISPSPRVSHIPPVVSHIPPEFLTFPQVDLTLPRCFITLSQHVTQKNFVVFCVEMSHIATSFLLWLLIQAKLSHGNKDHINRMNFKVEIHDAPDTDYFGKPGI